MYFLKCQFQALSNYQKIKDNKIMVKCLLHYFGNFTFIIAVLGICGTKQPSTILEIMVSDVYTPFSQNSVLDVPDYINFMLKTHMPMFFQISLNHIHFTCTELLQLLRFASSCSIKRKYTFELGYCIV